jgi:cell division protein FtsA
MLVQIIQPRLEETFEFVRDMLEVSGYSQIAGRRVVITGGASQLEGIRDLAELVLDKQVRLGRPKTIKGLPESVSGPAFATTAGLLRYAINEHVILPDIAETVSKGRGVGRIGQWLKENF